MSKEDVAMALMALERPTLTAVQVAPLVGLDPKLIRWRARHSPEKLGFPVVVAKSRVLIPRIPLLRHYGYWSEDDAREAAQQ